MKRRSCKIPRFPGYAREPFALYQGWIDRVIALEAATITGSFRDSGTPNAQRPVARRSPPTRVCGTTSQLYARRRRRRSR